MLAAKLVDNVWATRKIESLNGLKFMLAEVIDAEAQGQRLIVVDLIGAGIGDRVIICQGSSAGRIFEDNVLPIDAAVIGIIDEDCRF
ncbi:EutN/CcmL family microcompartment protein [Enterococcus sp. BWR-S5]|uniref:EutN/CcmL family microcompartment protein n=1 Tax=Enterococcus sp. BWR-S5 TaxID=2787714 RepID=UPI001921035C|nr:EutN/CcmL family microcompartment protein [Enterococcus sp. BWR-S5]MBL1224674.1 EutN/CcmL family microcompartment protein [Enterococcus sp. BWR-S5]